MPTAKINDVSMKASCNLKILDLPASLPIYPSYQKWLEIEKLDIRSTSGNAYDKFINVKNVGVEISFHVPGNFTGNVVKRRQRGEYERRIGVPHLVSQLEPSFRVMLYKTPSRCGR